MTPLGRVPAMAGGQAGRRAAGVVHLSTVHQLRDNRILNKECLALARAGLEPVLVVGVDEADAPAEVNGVRIVPIRRRSRLARLVASQAEAWQRLRTLRPAVLHVHDPELVPLALVWGRLFGSRVVVDAHEDLVGQVETKPYLNRAGKVAARAYARLLVVLASRGADAVVAATEPVAATFGGRDDVVVVRNVPWLGDFPQAVARPVPGRVVYAGDLTMERGLDTMLAVVERVPEAELVLAGRPLGSAADVVAHLPERVRHVGMLPPTEVPALVGSAQVGLIFLRRLPNYERSLPTKVFEYMAAGIPFLATDFPAWRELFGGFDAGVFVDTDDVEATAAALASMLADPARCAEMGANGRRAIEQHFRFEDEAPKLVALTRRLLEDR